MSQSYVMPAAQFEKMERVGNLLKAQLVGDQVHATEVFTGPLVRDVQTAMDARKAEIEQAGGSVFHRARIGRNSPCLCGSGLKFKKCCIDKALPVG